MPTASAEFVDEILDLLAVAREKVRARIQESNTTTEREVMATGNAVSTVVALATENVTELRQMLARLDQERRATHESVAGSDRYANEFSERIAEVVTVVSAAIEHTDQIGRVAAGVRTLASQASILSLNARIEAARSGSGNSGFRVIATEMKQLSSAIGAANDSIGTLADQLGALLPKLSERVDGMRVLTAQFSREVAERVVDARAEGSTLREQLTSVLSRSDTALDDIIKSSQEALSHLQFQDVVAQGLARMDQWLLEAEREICVVVGAEQRIGELSEVMHEEIGGDKAIDQQGAGDVMLF